MQKFAKQNKKILHCLNFRRFFKVKTEVAEICLLFLFIHSWRGGGGGGSHLSQKAGQRLALVWHFKRGHEGI
jgi:hypothetical protein